MRVPDYFGGSLVNLVNEIERRLTGSSPLPGLRPELSASIPEASTYVVVLFDGLGDRQLDHPRATTLASDRRATIDATFPSTTVVALSSLATGLAPAGHGVVSHFLNLEGHGVVNALKWTYPGGRSLNIDTSALLPSPNLWERLGEAGFECITVQPGNFENSPTSRLLYRGCRFEGVWSERDFVEVSCQLAATPGRVILTYLPHVDLAAHRDGQHSDLYSDSMTLVDTAWSLLRSRLPDDVALIGTADHGHVDYTTAQKHDLGRGPGSLFGDPRALFAEADIEVLREWASDLPGQLIEDVRPIFGPGDHPSLAHRLPTAILMADRGQLLIPSYMDDRLVGYHGGLDERELRVPLLVRA